MKSNLILKQFDKIPVAGTNSVVELRNYFGSKMMEIEDTINIDDKTIQYTELVTNDNNNGYQDFTNTGNESVRVINSSDLKYANSTITLQPQTTIDLENNTKWLIKINCKKILQEYLFTKLKESRVFKCISYEDLLGYDVNTFIRKYIDANVLSRYQFSKIDLYIFYVNVANDGNIFDSVKLKYNPIFDKNISVSENLVSNVNIQQISNIIYLDELKVIYNQIKKSSDYKFDYYFNIQFTKI